MVSLGPSQGCLTHRMYLHTFLPAPRALATNQLGPISCVPLPGPLQLRALPWFSTSIMIQWPSNGWAVAEDKAFAG